MKILVINGPNINMLGLREPEVYGKETFDTLCRTVKEHAQKNNIDVQLYQSNHEGDLVDCIQNAYGNFDGIVINPAAYTHTSIAILDALKAVKIPTVEVHISAVETRENFRQTSYIRSICVKTVTGKGIKGYLEAMDFLAENYK